MISTIDRGDDWAITDMETDEIVYDETQERVPFSTSLIIVNRGKYEGYKLSEVDDTYYLKFVRDKNLDDCFITYAFNKRLTELK